MNCLYLNPSVFLRPNSMRVQRQLREMQLGCASDRRRHEGLPSHAGDRRVKPKVWVQRVVAPHASAH